MVTFSTNIGPHDILYGYIRCFDKFDRKGNVSSTVTKELYISLFMSFKIFNFGQIEIIFVEIKTSNICYFANVNVYRYSYLINYFRTNLYFVINLKQNSFEIKYNAI